MKETNIHELHQLQKHMVVVFDEMRIKEDLVYEKHSGQVVGFVNLGVVNNQLSELERAYKSEQQRPEIATHMLVLMVRGLMTKINFPYAHFPTAGVTSDFLFSILWEAVMQLEMCEFKVIGVTSDGAPINRKFYQMHSTGEGKSQEQLLHKVRNPYSQENRWLYFFSDVPHLLKTTRNCWSHSFGNNHTRQLCISDKSCNY